MTIVAGCHAERAIAHQAGHPKKEKKEKQLSN